MTSAHCQARVSYFVAHDEFRDLLPLPAHDDNSDGSVTTLSLNHQWRVFIGAILDANFGRLLRDLEEPEKSIFADQWITMFEDLYD